MCPDDDEANWVTNFKRGILSALQNTMQRFDIDYKTTESDISGTCNVNYVFNGTEKTSILVKKEKDISSCINRYKTNSFLQTTPYDFRQQYAVWPLLRSTSYCNVSENNNQHIWKQNVYMYPAQAHRYRETNSRFSVASIRSSQERHKKICH